MALYNTARQRSVTTINEPVGYQRSTAATVVLRLVWLAASIVIALLALRFIFILLGANSANGFVNFIYTVSYPLARPFFGIFGYNIHYGISRVETASLVGIGVYLLAAYLMMRFLTIGDSRPAARP